MMRRLLSTAGRRVPATPLRPLFPFRVWRALFRLWLRTIRTHPDKRRAMRRLVELYDDAYEGLDLGAIEYGGGVHAKHRLTRYHDFFVERIRSGEHVLDVGCGRGELAHDIADRAGAEETAIDGDRSALELARRERPHPHVTYVQADAVSFVPPTPVDVAVLSSVLAYIEPRIEVLRALRERAGAKRLLIREPIHEREWTVPLRSEVGLSPFGDPAHVVEYDDELLRRELDAAGWTMGDPIHRFGEIWVEASAG